MVLITNDDDDDDDNVSGPPLDLLRSYFGPTLDLRLTYCRPSVDLPFISWWCLAYHLAEIRQLLADRCNATTGCDHCYANRSFVFPILQQRMARYVDCLPLGTDKYVRSNTAVTTARYVLQLIMSNGHIVYDDYDVRLFRGLVDQHFDIIGYG